MDGMEEYKSVAYCNSARPVNLHFRGIMAKTSGRSNKDHMLLLLKMFFRKRTLVIERKERKKTNKIDKDR